MLKDGESYIRRVDAVDIRINDDKRCRPQPVNVNVLASGAGSGTGDVRIPANQQDYMQPETFSSGGGTWDSLENHPATSTSNSQKPLFFAAFSFPLSSSNVFKMGNQPSALLDNIASGSNCMLEMSPCAHARVYRGADSWLLILNNSRPR